MHRPPAKSKEELVQEFRIQSIQEATMRVIARKGMAAATMQEIAEEAGVAKGTIYLYFRDRDELVEKTFETAIQQLHVQVDEALARELPFDQKIRAVLRAQFGFFRENAEFFRLYISLRMPEGSPQQQRRQKRACAPQYRSRIDALANVLQAAMDRGEIRQMDAHRLALFVLEGTMSIILQRLTEDTSPPEEKDVELIAGVLLGGISERSTN